MASSGRDKTFPGTTSLSKWDSRDPYIQGGSATRNSGYLSPSVFTNQNYDSVLTDRSFDTRASPGFSSQAPIIRVFEAGSEWFRRGCGKLGRKLQEAADRKRKSRSSPSDEAVDDQVGGGEREHTAQTETSSLRFQEYEPRKSAWVRHPRDSDGKKLPSYQAKNPKD